MQSSISEYATHTSSYYYMDVMYLLFGISIKCNDIDTAKIAVDSIKETQVNAKK
jgi:hypothetical protein